MPASRLAVADSPPSLPDRSRRLARAPRSYARERRRGSGGPERL